jgi:hypothetical protein
MSQSAYKPDRTFELRGIIVPEAGGDISGIRMKLYSIRRILG